MKTLIRNLAIVSTMSGVVGCTTPFNTGSSLTGGVEATALAEGEYLIRAGVNGYTPAGQLKPQIELKAKEIGASKGFVAYRIGEPFIDYYKAGGSFRVEADVHFFRNDELDDLKDPAELVSAPVRYNPAWTPTPSDGLATLRGDQPKVEGVSMVWLEPVYFDPLATVHFGPSPWTTYYVQPGPIHLLAYAFVVHKIWLPEQPFVAEVDGFLLPHHAYRLAAKYESGAMKVYLEEDSGSDSAPGPFH